MATPIKGFNNYKFRAECYPDVAKFLSLSENIVYIKSLIGQTIDDIPISDVVVEIYTHATIDDVRDIMKKVIDGYVMVETLNTVELYTGERWYYTPDPILSLIIGQKELDNFILERQSIIKQYIQNHKD